MEMLGNSSSMYERIRQPRVGEASIPLRTAEEVATETDMLRAEMAKDKGSNVRHPLQFREYSGLQVNSVIAQFSRDIYLHPARNKV